MEEEEDAEAAMASFLSPPPFLPPFLRLPHHVASNSF